jgi:hypothetical protein
MSVRWQAERLLDKTNEGSVVILLYYHWLLTPAVTWRLLICSYWARQLNEPSQTPSRVMIRHKTFLFFGGQGHFFFWLILDTDRPNIGLQVYNKYLLVLSGPDNATVCQYSSIRLGDQVMEGAVTLSFLIRRSLVGRNVGCLGSGALACCPD